MYDRLGVASDVVLQHRRAIQMSACLRIYELLGLETILRSVVESSSELTDARSSTVATIVDNSFQPDTYGQSFPLPFR